MKLDKVTVEKCSCDHTSCRKHGLSSGTGWSLEEAEEIAKRINIHDELVEAIQAILPYAKTHVTQSLRGELAFIDAIDKAKVALAKAKGEPA